MNFHFCWNITYIIWIEYGQHGNICICQIKKRPSFPSFIKMTYLHRIMHDEVSETENIRKNLAIERMIVEGCEILLDTSQTFVRQGKPQHPPKTQRTFSWALWKGPQIPDKKEVGFSSVLFCTLSLLSPVIVKPPATLLSPSLFWAALFSHKARALTQKIGRPNPASLWRALFFQRTGQLFHFHV